MCLFLYSSLCLFSSCKGTSQHEPQLVTDEGEEEAAGRGSWLLWNEEFEARAGRPGEWTTAEQRVSDFSLRTPGSLGEFVQHGLLMTRLSGSEWGPRCCILNKLPGVLMLPVREACSEQ